MRRSFHSRLTYLLREAQAAGDESAATGVPIDEVTPLRAERRAATRANTREMLQMYNAAAERAAERGAPADLAARDAAMGRFRLAATGASRRTVLKGAGTTAAAAVAAAAIARPTPARAGSQPRIVIVGAGAAGIRCAHKLWRQHGWRSTIYEWDDHPGGRIETLRGFFAGGQIAEMHGEFISSEHSAMLSLVSRFSLGLDDTSAYPAGTSDTYWFNGNRYTQAQLNSDWHRTYYPVFHQAIKAVPWPQTYRRSNREGPEMGRDERPAVDGGPPPGRRRHSVRRAVPAGRAGRVRRRPRRPVRAEPHVHPRLQRQRGRRGLPVQDLAAAGGHGRALACHRGQRPGHHRHAEPAAARHGPVRPSAAGRGQELRRDHHRDVQQRQLVPGGHRRPVRRRAAVLDPAAGRSVPGWPVIAEDDGDPAPRLRHQ